MCGRYVLYHDSDLASRFGLSSQGPLLHIEDNYNVAPGQFLPVITLRDDTRRVELMKWGLIPRWARDAKIGYRMINTRSETAFQKPFWRDSVRHRRCLVPARGFYEWRGASIGANPYKQPYYIYPKDQAIFAFAGIYDTWRDAEGHELTSFSLLTTKPNREMSGIHDRMPVVLRKDQEDFWLELGPDQEDVLQELLVPYPDGELTIFPVNNQVNSPHNNSPDLIRPEETNSVLQ